MNPFALYEVDSWLHRRNPTAKLAAHLALTLALTVVFDPLTPIVFLLMALAVGRLLARVPPLVVLKALWPFWLLSASFVLSNALFANEAIATTLLWAWGPFRATLEGLLIGLALAERSLAIAAFTLVFLMTTDPTLLVRSLVQQARMPARFAYPVLAAYRFLPLLADEWEAIRLAQRLRGLGRRRGLIGRVDEVRRLLVPFFASAIRKAERVALAMDSRGFGAERPRTHYRLVPFGRADVVLMAGAVAASVGIVWGSAALGILRLWTGAFGA